MLRLEHPVRVVGREKYLTLIDTLLADIARSGWKFDTIIALSRGGFTAGADLAYSTQISGENVGGLPVYKDSQGVYHLSTIVQLGDLTGRHVLVVDDSTDRGDLMRKAAEAVTMAGAASVRTCALVATNAETGPDFVGTVLRPLPKFYWELSVQP